MQRTLLFTAYYWPEATQNIFDPHILSFEQSRSSLESQFNILICVPGHSFLPLLCVPDLKSINAIFDVLVKKRGGTIQLQLGKI